MASREDEPQRVGLFGGSFDPIHVGHLHVARSAQAAFGLDRVVFVPAARSPHKRELTPASGADRLAMVRLAIEEEPTWSVSDWEVRRGGASYTVETVRALEALLEVEGEYELFLLIGDDNLGALDTWFAIEEILDRVQPIIVHRGRDPGESLAALRGRISEAGIEKLRRGFLDLPPVEVSSTRLRTRLGGEGQPASAPDPEVPARVVEYIRGRGLYGS